MSRSRILVTGATGYVARQILPALGDEHDLVLTDTRDTLPDGSRLDGVHKLDVLEDDPKRLTELLDGVDAVVHLAHRPAPGFQRPTPGTSDDLVALSQTLYEAERLNVDMAQRIYQTSLEAGVRRVVVASSNHASSWHQELYYKRLKDTVYPTEYPKPASFYGWAKVAYESLGFLYACGALGRKLESVLVRIVVPREPELSSYEDRSVARYLRDITGYLSPRDCAQLFARAVQTPDITDADGVPFVIVYATSNNARAFWSLETARRVLGYDPVDDSEERFAEDIARVRREGADALG